LLIAEVLNYANIKLFAMQIIGETRFALVRVSSSVYSANCLYIILTHILLICSRINLGILTVIQFIVCLHLCCHRI